MTGRKCFIQERREEIKKGFWPGLLTLIGVIIVGVLTLSVLKHWVM